MVKRKIQIGNSTISEELITSRNVHLFNDTFIPVYEELSEQIRRLQQLVDEINTVRDQDVNIISHFIHLFEKAMVLSRNGKRITFQLNTDNYVVRVGEGGKTYTIYYDEFIYGTERLYIGGDFTQLDNSFVVNNIAEWDYFDRGDFIRLGPRGAAEAGIPYGNVFTICKFNENLVVGGDFGKLVGYTGGEFYDIQHDNFYDNIYALIVYQDALYIGTSNGLYTMGDLSPHVYDLGLKDRLIYTFKEINNILYIGTSHGIYQLNDGIFSQIYDETINNDVYAIVEYNNQKYFGTDLGLYMNNEKILNNDNIIYTLNVYDSHLYVGGNLNGYTSNLLKLDTNNNETEIIGFNEIVHSIISVNSDKFETKIFVGGEFQDGIVTIIDDELSPIKSTRVR